MFTAPLDGRKRVSTTVSHRNGRRRDAGLPARRRLRCRDERLVVFVTTARRWLRRRSPSRDREVARDHVEVGGLGRCDLDAAIRVDVRRVADVGPRCDRVHGDARVYGARARCARGDRKCRLLDVASTETLPRTFATADGPIQAWVFGQHLDVDTDADTCRAADATAPAMLRMFVVDGGDAMLVAEAPPLDELTVARGPRTPASPGRRRPPSPTLRHRRCLPRLPIARRTMSSCWAAVTTSPVEPSRSAWHQSPCRIVRPRQRTSSTPTNALTAVVRTSTAARSDAAYCRTRDCPRRARSSACRRRTCSSSCLQAAIAMFRLSGDGGG